MMIVADLGTAQAAEQAFRRIGASAVQAESGLVVDPLGIDSAMQCVPVGFNEFIRSLPGRHCEDVKACVHLRRPFPHGRWWQRRRTT